MVVHVRFRGVGGLAGVDYELLRLSLCCIFVFWPTSARVCWNLLYLTRPSYRGQYADVFYFGVVSRTETNTQKQKYSCTSPMFFVWLGMVGVASTITVSPVWEAPPVYTQVLFLAFPLRFMQPGAGHYIQRLGCQSTSSCSAVLMSSFERTSRSSLSVLCLRRCSRDISLSWTGAPNA